MSRHQNADSAQGATQMSYRTIGQIADPAPVCARPKGEKRPSLREVAVSVLSCLFDSERREW